MWPIADLSCGTRLQICGPVAIGDVYICPVHDELRSVVAVTLPPSWQGSYDPADYKGRKESPAAAGTAAGG
jgi:hypothetical protein